MKVVLEDDGGFGIVLYNFIGYWLMVGLGYRKVMWFINF